MYSNCRNNARVFQFQVGLPKNAALKCVQNLFRFQDKTVTAELPSPLSVSEIALPPSFCPEKEETNSTPKWTSSMPPTPLRAGAC
ncbi:hypothetical protein CEXT_98431 [Caerostris extrusa]|uniref:Uncharacterized protein n=1 Tax=Caerostris extrusa TaxID=172846 RepID=A0AAV4S3S7_CAEEX|nr:hypothetical protein CEXT_98431 [Caerostris extrusa]